MRDAKLSVPVWVPIMVTRAVTKSSSAISASISYRKSGNAVRQRFITCRISSGPRDPSSDGPWWILSAEMYSSSSATLFWFQASSKNRRTTALPSASDISFPPRIALYCAPRSAKCRGSRPTTTASAGPRNEESWKICRTLRVDGLRCHFLRWSTSRKVVRAK